METVIWAGIIFGVVASLMLLVIWAGMIGDVLLTRSDVWALAGHDKVFCFCMVFALGPIGAILYGVAVRPSLARVEMSEAVREARGSESWSPATAA